MGINWFPSGDGPVVTPANSISDDLLHNLGCRACPLNKAKHIKSPKMKPSGSEKPLIYVIAEGPGAVEDEEGRQLVGPSGEYLWPYFPGSLRTKIRRNNIVNCRTSTDNRDPDRVEVECCRPRVQKDIEESKPAAIFGFGNFPLSWTGKSGGIELWRGRKFPVKIGSHICWFYPMYHPAFILRTKRNSFQSENELAFSFDIKRAIAEVEAGLPNPVVHTSEFAKNNITCIEGKSKIEGGSKKDLNHVLEFLEYAGTKSEAGVDYETKQVRPYYNDSVILTKAVSVDDETLAFGYEHPQAGWTSAQLELIRAAWVRFLATPTKKISHNASFEIEWTCFFYGLEYARSVPWEDTLSQAYVLDERIGALDLEFISYQYFGLNIKKLFRGLNKNKMDEEPLSDILPYNGVDAKYHRLNYLVQSNRLEKEGLEDVYQEKLRQIATTVLTQIKGVPIDVSVNRELDKEYKARIAEVATDIETTPEAKKFRQLTGQRFNPGSPQDVIVILKDVLNTRTGQTGAGWSTDESVLNEINEPITRKILSYRKVVKLKGTYVDPMAPGSDTLFKGNLLHQNLNTCNTRTGRLSSDNPNCQNIPIRTAEGRRVRKQFKSKVVASFDYGQIDGRNIANESRDKRYCKALWEDFDIHKEWAEILATNHPEFVGGKKYLKDVSVMKAFRNNIKSIWVFALFYGAALRTTARRFNTDEDTLQPEYKRFWKDFSGVKDFQERITGDFDTLGYIQLSGGVRRRVPLGHGQVINTPIQGATNRIVMLAMDKLSETGDWRLQPNMQIHDDLTYYFDSERDFEDCAPIIVDTMLDCREFPWICVPITVEVKVGTSWADMVEIGSYSSHKRIGWPLRAKEFM